MTDKLTIALYGASGALGTQVILAMEGEGLAIDRLIAVGSAASVGSTVSWRNRALTVVSSQAALEQKPDIAIFALPESISASLRDELRAAGCLVIDLSACGRQDTKVPLVWPLGDQSALDTLCSEGVSLPSATASTLLAFLKPALALGSVDGLEVTVLQGASTVGKAGPQALSAQTLALLRMGVVQPGPFPTPLAFNVIPALSGEDDGGRIHAELRRLLTGLDDLELGYQGVWIPTFSGLVITVALSYTEAPSLSDLQRALAEADDLDIAEGLPSLRDLMDRDQVGLAGLRVDSRGVARVTLIADGLQRTASAVGVLLDAVISKELW